MTKKTTAIVISGMGGVGKSYFAKHSKYRCLDLDSSRYKLDAEMERVNRDSHDYVRYMGDVIKNLPLKDFIMVSGHQRTRQHLHWLGIPFYYIAWKPDDKELCLKTIRERKTNQDNELIAEVVDSYWDAWQEDVHTGYPVDIFRIDDTGKNVTEIVKIKLVQGRLRIFQRGVVKKQ